MIYMYETGLASRGQCNLERAEKRASHFNYIYKQAKLKQVHNGIIQLNKDITELMICWLKKNIYNVQI